MVYETKEIQLKNGKNAIFRSPTVKDAAALLQYLKDTASQTPYLLRTPEECTMTLEQEEAYLENAVKAENKVMLLCEVDGELAGNCQLERKTHIKTCHRGMIGIALVKKFWGLGIGTAMFEELIRIARQTGIEQLELEVFSGNSRAIALYEKMGFRVVGAKPNAIRLQDGTMMDELYMVREV